MFLIQQDGENTVLCSASRIQVFSRLSQPHIPLKQSQTARVSPRFVVHQMCDHLMDLLS